MIICGIDVAVTNSYLEYHQNNLNLRYDTKNILDLL